MPRTLAVITVLFLAACGGGGPSAGGGGGGGVSFNGGQTSQYDGVRAVDLTCFDGSFWGECVVTWEDGKQQKVCEWTIFGCQQVGRRKLGQAVASVEYLDEFGDPKCLKLFESGWIDDCYNPTPWWTPTEGGDSSSAQSDSAAIDDGPRTETTYTTLTPPPPSLSLGSPQQNEAGSIYSSVDTPVMAWANFYLPIALANNSIESICLRPVDATTTAYLVNHDDFPPWVWPSVPQQSNCTKLTSNSETTYDMEVSALLAMHVVLGTFVDGYQGLENECLAKNGPTMKVCRTIDFKLVVKSSKAGKSTIDVRMTVHVFPGAANWVLLTFP